jgi:hypothetical protein
VINPDSWFSIGVNDAPAVGAATLPFIHRLLPTRAALLKVS